MRMPMSNEVQCTLVLITDLEVHMHAGLINRQCHVHRRPA